MRRLLLSSLPSHATVLTPLFCKQQPSDKRQKAFQVPAGNASCKTSTTGIPSVAVCEIGDRCRCGQIGDIRLTWAVTCTWKACRRGGCFAGSILPTSAGKAFCRLPESCYLQNSAVRTVARGDKRRRRLIRLSGSWRPRGISLRPAARLRRR